MLIDPYDSWLLLMTPDDSYHSLWFNIASNNTDILLFVIPVGFTSFCFIHSDSAQFGSGWHKNASDFDSQRLILNKAIVEFLYEKLMLVIWNMIIEFSN